MVARNLSHSTTTATTVVAPVATAAAATAAAATTADNGFLGILQLRSPLSGIR